MRTPSIERAGYTFEQVISAFCDFCGAWRRERCIDPQGRRMPGHVHNDRWRQFLSELPPEKRP